MNYLILFGINSGWKLGFVDQLEMMSELQAEERYNAVQLLYKHQ